MRQAIWAYATLWAGLIALCIVASRLAFAGTVGMITGRWQWMEQTHTENAGNLAQKLCPLCGKPMQKIHVECAHRDYELWTCVPCVKEGDRKRQGH